MSGRTVRGGGGRGASQKAKHGRGGRARRGEVDSDDSQSAGFEALDAGPAGPTSEREWGVLEKQLRLIDGQKYDAYKTLSGPWKCTMRNFVLRFQRIQRGRAAPSTISVVMPLGETNFPPAYFETRIRRTALADFIIRITADNIRNIAIEQSLPRKGWVVPKGSDFNINAVGQEVLERTSCIVRADRQTVELRFFVNLPAQRRKILGERAHRILCINLPELVRKSLLYLNMPQARLHEHIHVVEEQELLRSQLEGWGLVAFIANGSILPRASGGEGFPMRKSKAVPFRSPPELEGDLKGLNGPIRGMGIPCGVTILTGGGYHGKSTLLEAIQLGVYNHVPGDGRERVVTDPTAFKVRAEDGRRVAGLDITPFISELPGGRDTKNFSTMNASGSTSMASNIQEALELGSKLLLIDEDTSATNFLVRDRRMQELIKADPITPFIVKARALFRQHGVSTIIVISGCGDYLNVADTFLCMEDYLPYDYQAAAERIVAKYPASIEQHELYGPIPNRSIALPPDLLRRKRPRVRSLNFIEMKGEKGDPVKGPLGKKRGVDIGALEQIVEQGQAVFIGQVLRALAEVQIGGTMSELMDGFEQGIKEMELAVMGFDEYSFADVVATRRQEIGAALNRVKRLIVQGAVDDETDNEPDDETDNNEPDDEADDGADDETTEEE